MTATLVMTLAAPLQAWGHRSKYYRRETGRVPTKSGVLGLLAAARGIHRNDQLPNELVSLRFGVRADQPGRIIRDFHTAHTLDGQSLPLTDRYYLADAVFVVAVEGDAEYLAETAEALKRPVYPLFLGRRSCPPGRRIEGEVIRTSCARALVDTDWQAAEWHRRTSPKSASLDIWREPADDETGRREFTQDQPISFHVNRRRHGWRPMLHDTVRKPNPVGKSEVHIPAVLGG